MKIFWKKTFLNIGGDVKKVFERLAQGIDAVQKSIEAESGKKFLLDEKLGYLHSCPTNLGTGMRYEKNYFLKLIFQKMSFFNFFCMFLNPNSFFQFGC